MSDTDVDAIDFMDPAVQEVAIEPFPGGLGLRALESLHVSFDPLPAA